MRKLYILLLALAVVLPASLTAQRKTVRLTRYAGTEITGVSADHNFSVVLVKSNETKAVLEIDQELEPYLFFEKSPEGVVKVDLKTRKGMDSSDRKGKTNWKNRTLKLTLYLPEIKSIELGDMARLTSQDNFTGTRVKIRLEDMSNLKGLNLTADNIDIKSEDMSYGNINASAQRIIASADDMGKLLLEGTADYAKINCDDMANINGGTLVVQTAEMTGDGMSKSTLYVKKSVDIYKSGMASVQYKGNPSVSKHKR